MNEIIYLEPSEEITSLIDRLRTVPGSSVAFVIPRGATIAQSIVNLKLLKKSAGEMQKEISLVATDRISRNLASQIGLTVYSKVSEAQKAKPTTKVLEDLPKNGEDDDSSNSQFRVNNYYREKSREDDEDEDIKSELKEMAENTNDQEDDEVEKPQSNPNHNEDDKEEVEIKKRPLRHEEEPPRHIEPPDHAPKPQENHSTNIKGSRKIILVFASIFVVILIVSAGLLLPRATAKIQVKTEDFSAEKELTVDRNAKNKDVNKLTTPGNLVETEKEISKQFDATGKKDIGEKATGTLTFSNNAGVDDQIAAGTTVKSSGGVEFTVNQAVTVPKATASVNAGGQVQLNAGKANGKVTAKNSGEKSNLPSTTLYSVTGKSLITALGETAGGVSKELKVVTDDDISKAEASVKEELLKSAKDELIELAKKDKLSIFEDSAKSEVISFSSSKNANDEADKFDYTMKIKFYAIGFIKGDLNSMVIESSEKSLGDDKMLIDPEKAEINYELTDSNIDTGILTIKSKITGRSGQKLVDATIKNQIKGKSASSAKEIIMNNEGVEKVDVELKFNPFNRIPFLTRNISLSFGYDEKK